MTATLGVLTDGNIDRPFRWTGADVGRKPRASPREALSTAEL